jgi:S-(hydroxymethyl)glutathione dehydrogenase/alcohol dehydrogenase
MRFRAAVLVESRRDLEILDVDLHDRLKSGQVLIRILKTAICGSQLGEIDAIKGSDQYLPHMLGHEAIAIVEDSGDSKKVSNGDCVVVHWTKASGLSGQSPKYFCEGKQINAGQVTTFSEFSVVSENRITPIIGYEPKFDNLYSTVGCAHLTAYGVLRNILKIKRGSKILVVGGGGIGQAVIIQALLNQIEDIDVIESHANRRNYCKQLGATRVVSSFTRDELIEYDGIIECTGSKAMIEDSYSSLKVSGALALVGVTPKNVKIEIDPMPLHYGKSIIGVYGGSVKPSRDIPRILSLFSQQESIVDQLHYHLYSLDEINSAIHSMRAGITVGRAIVEIKM